MLTMRTSGFASCKVLRIGIRAATTPLTSPAQICLADQYSRRWRSSGEQPGCITSDGRPLLCLSAGARCCTRCSTLCRSKPRDLNDEPGRDDFIESRLKELEQEDGNTTANHRKEYDKADGGFAVATNILVWVRLAVWLAGLRPGGGLQHFLDVGDFTSGKALVPPLLAWSGTCVNVQYWAFRVKASRKEEAEMDWLQHQQEREAAATAAKQRRAC